MSESRIEPSKVTKPIQLLAAWLAGLILINASFLTAAGQISEPRWASSLLVIASVCNVPIFLLCLFLLQTKFRPEMQEDTFYARYLEKRISTQTGRAEIVEVQTEQPARSLRTPPRVSYEPEAEDIEINNLLPKYKEIVSALKSKKIHPTSTFGSTSQKPEVPDPFILSIGNGFSIRKFQTIFAVLLNIILKPYLGVTTITLKIIST